MKAMKYIFGKGVILLMVLSLSCYLLVFPLLTGSVITSISDLMPE